MKKLFLMLLVSSVLYLLFTAIITLVINPMVYIDETLKWQAQLFMVGNMVLTFLVTWLIFKKHDLTIWASIFTVVFVANALKIVTTIIDGDYSIAHILLFIISVWMFITLAVIQENE